MVVDTEEVAALRSRVRELETEQRLIQRELDSVADAATRADTQLRCDPGNFIGGLQGGKGLMPPD